MILTRNNLRISPLWPVLSVCFWSLARARLHKNRRTAADCHIYRFTHKCPANPGGDRVSNRTH